MAIDYLLYFCIMSRLFCDDDGHDGGGDDDDDDDIVIAIAIAAAVIVVVVAVVIIITTIVVPKQPKCSITISIYQHNMLQFTIPKALYTSIYYIYILIILYIPKDPRRSISRLETELGINLRPRLLFH